MLEQYKSNSGCNHLLKYLNKKECIHEMFAIALFGKARVLEKRAHSMLFFL